MTRFRPSVLCNAILLACTVLFCLLVLELAVRWISPQTRNTPTGLYLPHETRNFDLAVNALGNYRGKDFSLEFTTNSRGLKDFEIAPKTGDEFRVLCVGDSYSMGHGLSIDESFPKVLERLLRADRPRSHISVVNFGVGGYGPWQELSKLKDEGFDLQPDLVILQLYAENDIRDELERIGKRLQSTDAGYHRWSKMRNYSELRRALRRKSALFFLVDNKWQTLDFGIQLRPLRIRFTDPNSGQIPGRPWILETSLKNYYPELVEGWQLLEESVRGIRDECQSRSIPLYTLPIPADYELGVTMVRRALDLLGANIDPEQYDFSTNRRLMTAMLEKLALPEVDVYTPLAQSTGPSRYYWDHDRHFNTVGAQLVAELLKPVVWDEYRRWSEQGTSQPDDDSHGKRLPN